jgi:hypothetical protein
MKKRSASADTLDHYTERKVSGAKSKDASASASTMPKQEQSTLNSKYDYLMNEVAIWVECPRCGYRTDVYGQGDLDMWDEMKLRYPDCPVPTCRRTLVKSDRQYIEL